MLVCCQCSWQCLGWNRLRHCGVLPVLMTMSQLEQFETCWYATSANDNVSVGTAWDMLVCHQCSWQCLSWNSLKHVGVPPVLMTMSKKNRYPHCMSVRNSALYQTRTFSSGRTIGASMYLWKGSTSNVTMLFFIPIHFVTNYAWIPRFFTFFHVFVLL